MSRQPGANYLHPPPPPPYDGHGFAQHNPRASRPNTYGVYSETTPLNISNNAHRNKRNTGLSWGGGFVFLICLVSILISYGYCTTLAFKSSATKAEIERLTLKLNLLHREIAHDIAKQETLRQEWEKEVDGQEATRREWQRQHELMRRKWLEEVNEQEVLRRGWRREADKQEAMRRSWREEKEKHDNKCLADADKRLREEERRDAEKRAEMHLYWDGPTPAPQCSAYGARDYTARLWNIVDGYDWMEACTKTPIVLPGNRYALPDRCDIPLGGFSGVIGHWLVTSHQSSCEPRWGKFFDKECTGQGYRRVESRLWDVAKGEDSYRLCLTAPAEVHGIHFDQPNFCEEREHDHAMIGNWKVYDSEC